MFKEDPGVAYTQVTTSSGHTLNVTWRISEQGVVDLVEAVKQIDYQLQAMSENGIEPTEKPKGKVGTFYAIKGYKYLEEKDQVEFEFEDIAPARCWLSHVPSQWKSYIVANTPMQGQYQCQLEENGKWLNVKASTIQAVE